VRKIIL